MELYEVGGCVRDEILGQKSKDVDYSVVLTRRDFDFVGAMKPFDLMLSNLKTAGFEVFQSKPEYLTIRAKFPKNHKNAGLVADFVLARKEGDYRDGRRPDTVEVGTLEDDLARRDFTMNAIAKDSEGNLIDPFGGLEDIRLRQIKCVGRAHDRIIREDALRGLRAMRFSITKGFNIHWEIQHVLRSGEFRKALVSVSTERKREELEKMFKVDSVRTIEMIVGLDLTTTLFGMKDNLRLMPTMKG